MSTPALIYLAMTFVGIGVVLAQHGKPKTGNHNAWLLIAANVPAWALLWWGGFFSTGCTP